jgi:hypothetical protein
VQLPDCSWPVRTTGLGLGTIDHPGWEALAGDASMPTSTAAAANRTNLFMITPRAVAGRSRANSSTCRGGSSEAV